MCTKKRRSSLRAWKQVSVIIIERTWKVSSPSTFHWARSNQHHVRTILGYHRFINTSISIEVRVISSRIITEERSPTFFLDPVDSRKEIPQRFPRMIVIKLVRCGVCTGLVGTKCSLNLTSLVSKTFHKKESETYCDENQSIQALRRMLFVEGRIKDWLLCCRQVPFRDCKDKFRLQKTTWGLWILPQLVIAH